MSRITLAREYPDDRDVIAQICKLKSRTSATEKETSQIEQHLTETDGRVAELEEVTAGLDAGDIQTVKEVADTVQLHTTQIATLDGETEELMQDTETLQQDVASLQQNVSALEQDKQPVGSYVTTDTEQTITATKQIEVGGSEYDLIFKNPDLPVDKTDNVNWHRFGQIEIMGSNGTAGVLQCARRTRADKDGVSRIVNETTLGALNKNGSQNVLSACVDDEGNRYAVTNTPYNKAPAYAIPTLDWIWKTDANADNGLVHRNALENITGVKRFTAPLQLKSDAWASPNTTKTSFQAMDINFLSADNGALAIIRFQEDAAYRDMLIGIWMPNKGDYAWTRIARYTK